MTANQLIPLEPQRASTGGRPAIQYCEITANLICNWLEAGHFQCEFYELPEVPDWVTSEIIDKWREVEETFARRFTRARQLGAETLVKQAQDGLVKAKGRDAIYKARELAGLFWKRASLLNPRDFRETLDINVAGTVELKAVAHAPEWLQAAVKARKEAIDITPAEPEDHSDGDAGPSETHSGRDTEPQPADD